MLLLGKFIEREDTTHGNNVSHCPSDYEVLPIYKNYYGKMSTIVEILHFF